MTPLAQRLTRDNFLPIERRAVNMHGEDPKALDELHRAHCFELTEVLPLVHDLVPRMFEWGERIELKEKAHAFLPAPLTWIECVADKGQRIGWLLEQTGDMILGTVVWANADVAHVAFRFAAPVLGSPELGEIRVPKRANVDLFSSQWVTSCVVDAYAMLALINSPKVIGRKTRSAHAGLRRELERTGRIDLSEPLPTWSELTLTATPSFQDDAGMEKEAVFTGRKCLHFCRAHLRLQNGKLVLVSPHWRGDPALGVKRTRYKLKP